MRNHLRSSRRVHQMWCIKLVLFCAKLQILDLLYHIWWFKVVVSNNMQQMPSFYYILFYQTNLLTFPFIPPYLPTNRFPYHNFSNASFSLRFYLLSFSLFSIYLYLLSATSLSLSYHFNSMSLKYRHATLCLNNTEASSNPVSLRNTDRWMWKVVIWV